MIHAQDTKAVSMVVPQSIATNGTVTARVDTLGWEYLEVDVLLDSAAATTNTAQVIKLGEADVTTSSSFTNIVGVTGGTVTSTSVGFKIQPDGANTAAGQVARMFVDLRARKRYILLTLSSNAAGAQLCSAIGILSRGKDGPVTYSEKGAAGGLGIA